MDTAAAGRILADALRALREHGPRVRIVERAHRVGPERPDAVVEIRNGQHAKRYAAEIKQNVQEATIGAALLQRTGIKHPLLLVAEYIPLAIAHKLKQNDLPFIDAAGNAYIKQAGLFIWINGNRRRMPETPGLARRYLARAFEPAGLRVLFAFLCEPALVARPFREIARKADVAHGTVGAVMAELPHRNYVYDFGTAAGGRKLRNVDDLLARWAEAYARKLKPKLLLGRYAARNVNWWREIDPAKFDMVLGGEPAAARITRHLKPAVITFYGHRAEPRLIVDNALRADPKGNVEIAQRFWRVQTEEQKKGLAPLPLIYADLLATGDPRCIETAGLIRDRYLARLERQA